MTRVKKTDLSQQVNAYSYTTWYMKDKKKTEHSGQSLSYF
jgi:hypothetical protein